VREVRTGQTEAFLKRLMSFFADYPYELVKDFKLDGTAEEALQQIHDKQYALPFAMDQRKLICVGVNFSSKTRNIERWIIEE
jgi:hypothetical protein